MIKVKVLFFANFKEILNTDQIDVEIPKGSHIADLCNLLGQYGSDWLEVFGNPSSSLKVAVNQEMVEFSVELKEGDEVAFFPPVTGG